MAPGSYLGFHSAAPETDPLVRDDATNAKIADYLRYMGAPKEIIELQPKAEPTEVNYINRDQAKAWGVLKERPPVSTGAGSRPVADQ